ncbi:glycosyltransferase family 2 protein [Devosia sp.]|uniref:glycosyltransferase family 2 protein n=1 Tax=Devosia sp. TaxID=1871048 RepID=UPI003264EBAD
MAFNVETPGRILPRISVVTVVRNAESVVEATIASVLEQTYPEIEYVVVDGASTDKTFEIVQRHADKIDVMVSERDTGIYDAMNKAAKLATGDFIIYMNAGDRFFDARAVEEFVGAMAGDAVIYYSGWVVEYPWGHTKASRPKPASALRHGMIVQHQSVLVQSHYMRTHPFDPIHGNGADFALLAEAVSSGTPVMEVPGYLSIVSTGGVSDTQRIPTTMSHWRTARQFFPGFGTDARYAMEIANQFFRIALKRVLPKRLVEIISERRA